MEISDQLKEAARRVAERHEREGVTLPAEIPGNPGICLAAEDQKEKIKVFGAITIDSKTYLIGSCID